MKQPHPIRLVFGYVLNILIWTIPLAWLAGAYMDLASNILGESVSWPQISLMSAYPEDVRNGYLFFVAAVITITILSSGVLAALLGASPGKAALNVCYTPTTQGDGSVKMLIGKRCAYLVALVLLVLTPGPILGFLYGPAADIFSLIALVLGICILVWAITPWGPNDEKLSPLNRIAGLRPTMRN